uniref:Uncharacterized protein n=1 Tax=Anguilla anguilla TaxID=7936 RepID=A0A0E9VDT0_ANGAN
MKRPMTLTANRTAFPGALAKNRQKIVSSLLPQNGCCASPRRMLLLGGG